MERLAECEGHVMERLAECEGHVMERLAECEGHVMERRHLAGGPPPSRWLVERVAGWKPANRRQDAGAP